MLTLGHFFLSAPVAAITTGFPCQKLTAVQSQRIAGGPSTHAAPCRHVDMLHLAHQRPPALFPFSLWFLVADPAICRPAHSTHVDQSCAKQTAELESVSALVMATATPARYCVRWPGRATGFICR